MTRLLIATPGLRPCIRLREDRRLFSLADRLTERARVGANSAMIPHARPAFINMVELALIADHLSD
jgi:hypothetical protein